MHPSEYAHSLLSILRELEELHPGCFIERSILLQDDLLAILQHLLALEPLLLTLLLLTSLQLIGLFLLLLQTLGALLSLLYSALGGLVVWCVGILPDTENRRSIGRMREDRECESLVWLVLGTSAGGIGA